MTCAVELHLLPPAFDRNLGIDGESGPIMAGREKIDACGRYKSAFDKVEQAKVRERV